MDESYLFSANHRLNSINLSSLISPMPLEVFSLRYVEDMTERRNPLNTPGLHRHTYFELHLPVTGEQAYQLDNHFITLHAGEMLLISPSIYHSLPYSSDDLAKFSIAFMLPEREQANGHGWICDILSGEKPFHFVKAPARIKALFEEIFHETAEAHTGYQACVEHLIFCLITEIARAAAPESAENAAISRKTEVTRRTEQMERFIRDNVSVQVTCAMLSDFMHLSVKQLNRDVQQTRSMSLRELIEAIRFSEAKRLLGNQELTREEIASSVGFQDAGSFNRFFKRKSGMPPSVYRKIHAQEGGEGI